MTKYTVEFAGSFRGRITVKALTEANAKMIVEGMTWEELEEHMTRIDFEAEVEK
jgi:hypothetical protein